MARIEYKPKVINKEMLKKIREFIKDYDTHDLTIVLSDDWTYKYSGKKYSAGKTTRGRFHYHNHYYRHVYKGHYGFNKMFRTPLIAVKLPCENWYWVFCHEFGHYLDWKTRPEFIKKRTHGKERSADEFADLASGEKKFSTKTVNEGVNLNNDDAVIAAVLNSKSDD